MPLFIRENLGLLLLRPKFLGAYRNRQMSSLSGASSSPSPSSFKPPHPLPSLYDSHNSFGTRIVPNAGETPPENVYADPAHHQRVN